MIDTIPNNILNTITRGDAMELIDDIPDNSVDLVVLDPNYQDWKKLLEDGVIVHAVRVLKATGNLLCFTKQPFDFALRQELDHIFRREIIWTFENGGAWVSNRMPLVSHQKIYWATVSNEFYFNPRTGMPYAQNTKAMKRTNKVFSGYIKEGRDFVPSDEGTWLRDHLHSNKPSDGAIPSKPMDIANILVKCFCPKDGICLDMFCGSGNFSVACKQSGINFVAFEKDCNVIEIAERKIKANYQYAMI